MKKEKFFYTLGLLLIAAALLLTLYNTWENKKAGAAASQALSELQIAVPAHSMPEPDAPEDVDMPDYLFNPDIPMPVTLLNGYAYVGVLSIPALELELPVLNEWDYERLDIGPCRFSGSIYRGDMVICGHNYPLHFGRLRELRYGDTVTFKDVEGNVFPFTVAEIEILPSTALEEMNAGEYPLTLFTCDLNRTNRITLRMDALHGPLNASGTERE